MGSGIAVRTVGKGQRPRVEQRRRRRIQLRTPRYAGRAFSYSVIRHYGADDRINEQQLNDGLAAAAAATRNTPGSSWADVLIARARSICFC